MIQQLCGVWVQDFLLDLKELEREIDEIPLRGLKGTTGTQVRPHIAHIHLRILKEMF